MNSKNSSNHTLLDKTMTRVRVYNMIKAERSNQFVQNCFLKGGPAENTMAIDRYIKLVTIKSPKESIYILNQIECMLLPWVT